MAIEAGSILAYLDLDTGQFNTKLDEAKGKTDNFSNSLEGYGSSFQKVGQGLTVGVTVPIVGIGVAAAKTGMDFEAGMSRVQAIAGATSGELESLTAQALQLGADTAFSASEVASGMENLASAGFSANEIMQAMPGLLDLAAVSGGDVANASDVAATAIRGFGIEAGQAGHVADVFARAAADTNAECADMGEAMKYVAPVAHAMGLSLEETAAAVGIMSDAGIKGSQAGTTLRGALSRLAKPTKAMKKVMDKLGISFYDSEGKMVSLKDQVGILQTATAGMTQEEKNQVLVTLYGQESLSGMLALVDAGPGKLGSLTDSLVSSDGAAKDMADTMMNNTAGAIEEMSGALETARIKVFEAMAPTITKVANAVGALADKFNALSPEAQQAILQLAGLAAAVGPVIIVGRKLSGVINKVAGLFSIFGAGAQAATTAASTLGGASGLGGLVGAGGKAAGALTGLSGAGGVGGALGGLTAGLGSSLAAMAPWVAGAVLVTTAATAIYKKLQEDSIPAVNVFDETISEGTKKAVGSFLDLEKNATESLDQMNWSGEKVSSEMAKNVTGNIDQMAQQVISKVQEQKEKAVQSISEMASQSKTMTEQEKKDIVRLTGEKYDEQIKKTQDGNAKIKQIMDTAAAEHRTLTEKEKTDINQIKENMKNDGVKILSNSEKEQLAIMEDLKSQSGNISARQAADVVKNSKSQMDNTIKNANKEYQDRLKYAAQLRADGTKESSQLADKVVQEAKRQKDDSIRCAKEMHQNVVKEAKNQAHEHVDQIDWESGHVKTKWQQLVGWFKDNPIVRYFKSVGDTGGASGSSGSRRISGASKYASGTKSAKGGLAWVGEKGPELVELPRGSKVYTNGESKKLATADGGNIYQEINIHSSEPLSPNDVSRKVLQASRQFAMEWEM